jgi:hypothetical protein
VSCNDFQAKLDLYIDGELARGDMRHAEQHVAGCAACDALVTRHQRLHAFLVTAATDRVAAVDVSGLWDGIEERLGQGSGPFSSKPGASPISERIVGWLGMVFGDAGFTPARVGAFAAAAAAAVVFLVSWAANDTSEPGATSTMHVATATPTARVRPVRIDSMEVGEGHTVSTWMRPKRRTRVFWVAAADDSADGFGVESTSFDR